MANKARGQGENSGSQVGTLDRLAHMLKQSDCCQIKRRSAAVHGATVHRDTDQSQVQKDAERSRHALIGILRPALMFDECEDDFFDSPSCFDSFVTVLPVSSCTVMKALCFILEELLLLLASASHQKEKRRKRSTATEPEDGKRKAESGKAPRALEPVKSCFFWIKHIYLKLRREI